MPKRVLQGVVVSDACDKTVIVRVERRVMHPVYKKFITRSKKYMAHDEGNAVRIGDLVRIQESRPISRHKHWRVIAVLEVAAQRGRALELPAAATPAGVPAVTAVASADVVPELLPGAPGAPGAPEAAGREDSTTPGAGGREE